VDILPVDAYSGVELCTAIFLGGDSKKHLVANHFRKNQNSNRHILNKAQQKQESLCG
jgi:hypothetical protein